MRYLFFDTETTGVPINYKAPVTDLDNWPRLVQIAWQIFNDDKLEEEQTFIIKPDGFSIPGTVASIHGIGHDKAVREGKELKAVLDVLVSFLRDDTILVAHNMNFDKNILGAELLRVYNKNYIENHSKICTMLNTINYCKLPGRYGFKWPKLNELYNRLFGKDFENAHDALNDIRATSECFFELRKQGFVFRYL